MSDIKEIIGKTAIRIKGMYYGSESCSIHFDDGSRIEFWHEQDCCECVNIYDVCGDVSDLIGNPLIVASEADGEGPVMDDINDSYTWTFYEFATNKGSVTVRWLGSSNGYYSEYVEWRVFAGDEK